MSENSDSLNDGREHIRVHPSVLFKLGEDLITDEVQALVELIKNSYDADSPIARVRIETDELVSGVSSIISLGDTMLKGSITIQDNGVGMTRSELVEGWLTVSNSWKRQYKSTNFVPKGRIPPKRTPLGDKGLGRLGAQRLGDVLELRTRSKLDVDHGWRVVIPWRDFDNAATLEDVRIDIEPLSDDSSRFGTTLRILGLHDAMWAKPEARNELQRQLATLISPFGQNRGFRIEISINGSRLDLYELTRIVRAASELNYKFAYRGGDLHIGGVFKPDFFRPNLSKDLPRFNLLMESDGGKRFVDWLYAHKSAQIRRFGLSRGNQDVLLQADQVVQVVERSTNLVFQDGHLVDPGPFSGELDSIDLSVEQPSVFSSKSQYRDFVRSINGIKVYRNGFGIRTDDDWLGLAKRWSSGRSFYSLRPENVIGYIDITAEENAQLEEVTDREGFRSTPAYQNFYSILQIWLDYTADLQSMLRRSWNEFDRSVSDSGQRDDESVTPEQLLHRVDRAMREVAQTRQPLEQARDELGGLRKQAKRVADRSAAADPQRAKEIISAAAEIQSAADRVTEITLQVQETLGQLEEDRRSLIMIGEQIQVLRDQLSDAWATVALGITAEALTHEMLVITDKLLGGTRAVDRYLTSLHSSDQEIRRYVESVRSSVNALAKQLDHLNPGLSYVRDRRDRFDVGKALKSISEFYEQRFASVPITLKVEVLSDFRVLMSRG